MTWHNSQTGNPNRGQSDSRRNSTGRGCVSRLLQAAYPLCAASGSCSQVLSMARRVFLLPVALLFTTISADAQFTVSPTSFLEGVCEQTGSGSCTGIVRFTVTNIGSGQTAVNVATKSGTATQGSDFRRKSGSSGGIELIQFGSISFELTVINDTAVEGDEHFFLTVNGTDHRITIQDNDVSPEDYTVSTLIVAENAGTQYVRVEYTGSSTRPVRLDYQTKDGTATAPGDYTARTPLKSSLNANNVIKTRLIRIDINNDDDREGYEHFFMTVNDVDHQITSARVKTLPVRRQARRI